MERRERSSLSVTQLVTKTRNLRIFSYNYYAIKVIGTEIIRGFCYEENTRLSQFESTTVESDSRSRCRRFKPIQRLNSFVLTKAPESVTIVHEESN